MKRKKTGEPLQANGTRGRDSPKALHPTGRGGSEAGAREGSSSLSSASSEKPVSPAAPDGVGDHTTFNSSKLDMNYSNKLKQEKKTSLGVNVTLTDFNIW